MLTRANSSATTPLVPPTSARPDAPSPSDPSDRRVADRFDVSWTVDCETDETFLYASISNISEMGIFVRTSTPFTIGTHLLLKFCPPTLDAFSIEGIVQWVNPVRVGCNNPNPGMGIRFVALSLDDRERIVEAIRTIAYVRSN